MASYHRNRDYSKQFSWTYELNENYYQCHDKANEDRKIGYMNRLKSYRDEMFPQLFYLTSKNLRDQASRIEKRKTALTTQNIEMNAVNTAVNNEVQNVDEPTTNDTIDQQQTIELPCKYTIDPIKESLATIFKRNYSNYIHKSLSDRTIDTVTNKD